MIFKKKDKIPMKFGLMLGMKVCVAKFNVKKNRDEAKVGYIIARRQYFTLRSNPYEEGGSIMKVILPLWIQNLKDGPHKRDMIKHYKRQFRKEKNGKCGKLTASPNRG